MPIDPDDLPLKKKHTEIVLGQDLSMLSEFELGARIMDMEMRDRTLPRGHLGAPRHQGCRVCVL